MKYWSWKEHANKRHSGWESERPNEIGWVSEGAKLQVQQAEFPLKNWDAVRDNWSSQAQYTFVRKFSRVRVAQGGLMFRKIKAAGLAACAVVLSSAVLLGQAPKAQEKPGAGASSNVDTGANGADGCVKCELPIILRQSVEAGKTAVGTKVEARLVMATMINGGVVPRDAVISGEVIESVAKSGKSSSRLAIRMDSAQWKDGGAKFKAYLTAWYYPPAPMAAPDLSYGPQGDRRNWGGTDATVDTTDPPNPAQKLSTHQDTGMNVGAPASVISMKRVPMNNVKSTSGEDGSLVLFSSRSNIKLNKVTTYVLATNELLPGK